jgi:hypothetical protein
MRISKQIGVGVLIAASCALAVTNCEPPGACLRNSDCDQNLTCSAGHCVVPSPSDGAAPESDASVVSDAESFPDTMTSTTSVSDANLVDATLQDSSSPAADAGLDDAAQNVGD